MPDPLSVIILTYNEEDNLPACLESLKGLDCEIFVVDSGSTDRTREIAVGYGARVAGHPFESHAKQWNWALRNLELSSEWVLCLDADHRVTSELRNELCQLFGLQGRGTGRGGLGAIIKNGELEMVDGFYIKRRQVFQGKLIRHGGYNSKYLLKLVRRNQAWSDEKELADHRFYVRGKTARLCACLIEDNQNERDILMWVQKHVIYADRQAKEEFLRQRSGIGWNIKPSPLGTPDQRTLWLKSIWYRMPLYVRPFLYFIYRYIFRLGFLDGRQGFIFHFLQGFWYRLLVDIKILEYQRDLRVRER